jgi:hypothetical protein
VLEGLTCVEGTIPASVVSTQWLHNGYFLLQGVLTKVSEKKTIEGLIQHESQL